MNVLFSSKGDLIRPHLKHTLKSFYYVSEVELFYTDFSDASDQTVMCYPESHWIKKQETHALFSKLKTESQNMQQALENDKQAFTYTVDDQFVFLLAPIIYDSVVKGALVAGPIVLCKCSAPSLISSLTPEERHALTTHAVLRKPPRHIYLGQMMHHLLHKSVYVGPSSAMDKPKHYISQEDMTERHIMSDMHMRLQLIADMVLGHQKQEALSIYKKSALFESFSDTLLGDETLALKQMLFTLETMISGQLLKVSGDTHQITHLKNAYFSQILSSNSFTCLMTLGENIIKVYSEIVRKSDLDGKSLPVRKALMYIQEHFKTPLQLSDVSLFVKRSNAYLSSLFKEEVGISITECIQVTRINYSKHLLKYTQYSILEVALESGFENQNYYATVFKKLTGYTPKAYRDHM